MTGYVATRWYRAPEIMLNWMHYNQTGDVSPRGALGCAGPGQAGGAQAGAWGGRGRMGPKSRNFEGGCLCPALGTGKVCDHGSKTDLRGTEHSRS